MKSLFVLFVSHPVTIFSPTRNRAGNFSVARLMEFLTALCQEAQIIVRPSRKPHGALSAISL